jgi:hypothetical protein
LGHVSKDESCAYNVGVEGGITEFVAPKAKLLIETPVNTIRARGGSSTVQTLRSTHSLLTTMSEEKPKRMLAMKSNPLVKSNETCKLAAKCFIT